MVSCLHVSNRVAPLRAGCAARSARKRVRRRSGGPKIEMGLSSCCGKSSVYSQAGRVFIARALRGAVDFTARRTGVIEGSKRTSQASRTRRTDAISVASSLARSVSRPMKSRNVVRITTFFGRDQRSCTLLAWLHRFRLPDDCCCTLDAERTGKVADDRKEEITDAMFRGSRDIQTVAD